MKLIFFAFLAFLALLASFDASALTMDDLKPSSTDGFMMILNNFFGDVGGIFGTGNTTVIGDMMGIFNAGVMILAGVLVGYILLSGTLKTAHEGEALGRAWSSIFIPLRTSLGVGLIIPGPGGYALVNIALMYIAVGGVGIANKVWYVAAENIMFGKPNLIRNIDANTVVAGTLKSMLCQANQNKIENDNVLNTSGNWDVPTITQTPKSIKYSWGQNAACGSMEFGLTSNTANQLDDIYRAKALAMQNIVFPATKSLASYMVEGNLPANYNEYVDAVSANYTDYVKSVADKAYEASSKDNAFLNSVRKDGFVLAGGAYLQITKIMKLNNTAASETPVYISPAINLHDLSGGQELDALFATADTAQKANIDQRLRKATTPQEYAETANDRIKAAGSFSIEDIKGSSLVSKISKLIGEVLLGIVLTFFAPAVTLVSGYGVGGDLMGNFATYAGGALTGVSNGAPLLSLMHLGETLEVIAAGIFSIFVAGPTTLHAVANAVPTFGIGNSMTTFAITVAPMIYTIIAGLGAAGLSLSNYLPLLPAITWVLAIVSLLIILFESMIASTIWACMHISPDGHEWSGKGAEGYLLVLGVFLRPVLMIFGLVGGIMLFNLSVMLLNFVFLLAVQSFGGVGVVAMVVIICLYVFTAIKLFHRCLSMITELPSGIMRWIGGGNHGNMGEDPQHSGSSFIAGISNRVESAGSSALAAKKGLNPVGGAPSAKAADTKTSNDLMPTSAKEQTPSPMKSSNKED